MLSKRAEGRVRQWEPRGEQRAKGTGWYRPKHDGKTNKNNNGERGDRVGEDGREGVLRKRRIRETRVEMKWWQWLAVAALVWATVGLMGYAGWYGMPEREGVHPEWRQNEWPAFPGIGGEQQGDGPIEGYRGAGQVGRQQSTWGEPLAQEEEGREGWEKRDIRADQAGEPGEGEEQNGASNSGPRVQHTGNAAEPGDADRGEPDVAGTGGWLLAMCSAWGLGARGWGACRSRSRGARWWYWTLMLSQAHAMPQRLITDGMGGVIKKATAAAVAAAGGMAINAVRSYWAQRREEVERTLVQRLDDWQARREWSEGKYGDDLWEAERGKMAIVRGELRDELLELIHAVELNPELWAEAKGKQLMSLVVHWDLRAEEQLLVIRDRQCPVMEERALWVGDCIEPRARESEGMAGTVRMSFHNIRRFKAGLEGWMLKDEMWEFHNKYDMDFVCLEDHWLKVTNGDKFDRTAVNWEGLPRYRCSGVQARSARGFDGEGWGGDGMQWAIGQGMTQQGANRGPVSGTLMAVRSGWHRADQEVHDPRGWGRFVGKKILGGADRRMIVVTVQAPSASGRKESGTQWYMQQTAMNRLARAGEKTESNPREQLLKDLHRLLLGYLAKGYTLVVGGDWNMAWQGTGREAELMNTESTELQRWAKTLDLVHAMRERGHGKVTTWKKSESDGACETEIDHVLVSRAMVQQGALVAAGVYKGIQVNGSDHMPVVVEIRMHWLMGLDEQGVRMEEPKKEKKRKKLRLTNGDMVKEYQDELHHSLDEEAEEDLLRSIEGRANEMVEARDSWEDYGKEGDQVGLAGEIERWLRRIAQQLVEAESAVAKEGEFPRYQQWSQEYVDLKGLKEQMETTMAAVSSQRMSDDNRRTQWLKLKEEAVRLGHGGLVAAVQEGRVTQVRGRVSTRATVMTRTRGSGWRHWVEEQRGEGMPALMKLLHAKGRAELRERDSKRQQRVAQEIEENRWAGVIRSQLKKDWTTGDKAQIIAEGRELNQRLEDEAEERGEELAADDERRYADTDRRLVQKGEAVKLHLSWFFARWMGKLGKFWFRKKENCFVRAEDVRVVAAMEQGTEDREDEVRNMDWVRSREMREGSWTEQMQEDWEEQRSESMASIQVAKEAAAELRSTSNTHCWYQRDVEGKKLRRALVRGHLSDREVDVIRSQMHEQAKETLEWLKRKTVVVSGERRELSEADYRQRGVMELDQTEWEVLIRKMAPNKAADSVDVHVNLMKALLAETELGKQDAAGGEATVHPQGAGPEGNGGKGAKKGKKMKEKREHRESPVRYVADLIRRMMRVVLRTGLYTEMLAEELLCTINKVPGSIAVIDTRPIGLVNLWRNMLMGNQLSKVSETLEEMKGLADWQSGFRKGKGTDTPLLETRLVAEHCWVYRRDLWVGDDDKRHAFDSPQRDGGIDVSLDRMAIPYELIMLIMFTGEASQMRVRTAYGLGNPFGRMCGNVQGGRDSPDLWDILDDILCTVMEEMAVRFEGVKVEVPFRGRVWVNGKAFADDLRFLARNGASLEKMYAVSGAFDALMGLQANVKKGGCKQWYTAVRHYTKRGGTRRRSCRT